MLIYCIQNNEFDSRENRLVFDVSKPKRAPTKGQKLGQKAEKRTSKGEDLEAGEQDVQEKREAQLRRGLRDLKHDTYYRDLKAKKRHERSPQEKKDFEGYETQIIDIETELENIKADKYLAGQIEKGTRIAKTGSAKSRRGEVERALRQIKESYTPIKIPGVGKVLTIDAADAKALEEAWNRKDQKIDIKRLKTLVRKKEALTNRDVVSVIMTKTKTTGKLAARARTTKESRPQEDDDPLKNLDSGDLF